MEGNWLAPEEQRQVCEAMVRFGLVKWDNRRTLPLKSGGMTDIYVNLRDGRNRPDAIRFIARQFENPLFRLQASRFGEVPDSVSCFAGVISTDLNLPMVTLRDRPKEGRVAKADMIGEARFGEYIPMIDDVITDGASKIGPYRKLTSMGIKTSLIVLVDRQQGWKKKFAEEGINMDVWAGMTLHDVRAFLINRGLMERCEKVREERNPIILALDGKSWEEILPIVDQLRTSGCIFKVNDLLFARGIDDLVPRLSVYGRVMADLKIHDIPNTMGNIAKRLLVCPPWAVTVHASADVKGVQHAVKALEGTPTKVLGVTLLTSLNDRCEEVYVRRPVDQVKKLAEINKEGGAHGMVCSGEEVRELKQLYPEMTLVVPGVRSPGVDHMDQKRVVTPREALDNGASNFVGGRQFLGASDPVAEVNRVIKEELGIQL